MAASTAPDVAEPAWTRQALAERYGVGEAWVDVVVARPGFPSPIAGGPRLWCPAAVTAWERRYAAQAYCSLSPKDLRIVALRLIGLPTRVVAARAGVHVHTVRARARDAGLRLALVPARSTEGASWARLRAGYPPDTGLTPVTRQRVRALWLDGATWSTIAAAVGVPLRELRARVARSGLDLPPRWFSPQVTAYLGWSRSHIYGQSRRRTLPPPDGTDEHGRSWWWPATIEAWAADLTRCPDCGAAVQRLTQHRRRHR